MYKRFAMLLISTIVKANMSTGDQTQYCQHLRPDPIAKNVPNEPPPCNITFPTVLTNSFPRRPPLKWKTRVYKHINA